jgi:hypothetical protein
VFGRPHRQPRRRVRDQRGAVAVEAALVLPILFTMLFGIIELSLLVRDEISTTSATRVAARIAATGAGAGQGDCNPKPCTPPTSPKLAQLAADALEQTGLSMPKDSIDYVLVYKANDKGYPGAVGNKTMPSSCASTPSCVMFKWIDAQDAFRYDSGAWDSTSINACVNQSDLVGIYLHSTHRWVSGLFGSSIAVSDRAVTRFEPLNVENCAPTKHP